MDASFSPEAAGVKGVFPLGTARDTIVRSIRENAFIRENKRPRRIAAQERKHGPCRSPSN